MRLVPLAALCLSALASAQDAAQDPPTGFARHRLSRAFTSEGASFADLDRDGHADVIAGPYWYAGPDFAKARTIYPVQVFDPLKYSDHFFSFPDDLDGDGWTDVLVVGFPGKEARWYRNRGRPAEPGAPHWERHDVLTGVDNESPHYVDLDGDGRRELVFLQGGRYGWAGPDPSDPALPWRFHALSPDLGLPTFTHGLGVGDVDGDGRLDVLERSGWWRQPASLEGDPQWERHEVDFAERGGAQMLVTDADGDGDADVVTSLDAHGFGLVWYEQRSERLAQRGGEVVRRFVPHTIMGSLPGDSPHGLRVSELHALALADVDGDGIADIVTGKRHWAHGPQGSPDAGAPSLLVWFRCVRGADGVVWEPRIIDADSGVGTQVVTGDVDGDGRVDVVVGNKQGVFVHLQRQALADPVFDLGPAVPGGVRPTAADGRPLNLGFERGDLTDWIAEGAAFADQPVEGDTVTARGREASRHAGRFWLGGYELHGDGPQGTLRSVPFTVTHPWASLLVGGGNHHGTRVELLAVVDDGTEAGGEESLWRSPGANYESLQRVVIDLREHRGRQVFLRVVDAVSGGWGHVNYDDFLFHAEEPTFERPAGVPEILAPDFVPHAGLRPEEALAAMSVPDGFAVDLIAAEPDLHQPVALTTDAKGRLWVAEAHAYPRRVDGDVGPDRIVVFSDEDGDGSFETRTVFLEGLNLVSGLAVGHGGVWIGAAPWLLFVPDADRDLVPDGEAVIELDGWAYEDTHETLNAFTWGPDGWLYGCHGVFTHSRVGRPGTPDAERTPINAGVWRFHPVRKRFEVFAHGTSNPWGVDFDQYGEAFVTACVIPHLYHLVPGGRYLRQAGQHFEPYTFDDIDTIADHRHYLGATPHGGNNRSDTVGGGHAHCGALIYRGGAFPGEYDGALLMHNIHGNRINADRLVPSGSTYVGEHRDDLLRANDSWFRGIALETGPDGSVYFIDWYDQRACHWTAPEVWDRSNGRLYRLRHGDHQPWSGDLTQLGDDELVDLLTHENQWFVRQARLLLAERAAAGTFEPGARAETVAEQNERFRELAQAGLAASSVDTSLPQQLFRLHVLLAGPDEVLALEALWTLHVLGALDEGLEEQQLRSEHPRVRAWTVRLGAEDGRVGEGVARLWYQVSQNDSLVGQRELASALQRLSPEDPLRWDVVSWMLQRRDRSDPDDPVLPLLLWYGWEPLVPGRAAEALRLAAGSGHDRLAEFVVRRLAEDPASAEALLTQLAMEPAGPRREAWLTRWIEALGQRAEPTPPEGWSSLAAEVQQDGSDAERALVLRAAALYGDPLALPVLSDVLLDRGRPLDERRAALASLARMDDPAVVPVLGQVITQAGLGAAALSALAAHADREIAQLILEHYGAFDLEQRRAALNTLASRPHWALSLLATVLEGSVPREDLSAFVLRLLAQHDDKAVHALLRETVGVVREADAEREQQIADWLERLTPEVLAGADLAAGGELFAATCQQCHTLWGQGGQVGPELTGANRGDLEYLLRNVLDPSAVVGKDYQATTVWLRDGRVITGLAVAENDETLTLRSETEEVVVAKADIDTRRLSELSLMADGLVDALTDPQMADLMAYLGFPRRPPRRATQLLVAHFNASATTDLSAWSGDPDVWSVEDGVIVGRSETGLDHNSFLTGNLELGDFRFSCEVLLVDDQGNSGIQFRSRPAVDGDVSGYQADIGPGWWGKLYEEHGRGLLWEASGEALITPGEWVRYEIEARGHHVITRLNGETSVDLVDEDGALRGVMALQVHSGGPTEVRFRDLRLELLD